MDLGIEGKLALVTGAGRGIGRAIALALGREGARLILIGRSLEHLEEVRTALPGNTETHHLLSIDLMPESLAEEAVTRLNAQSGPPDIVVHNVGGSLGISDPFAPYDDWCRVWRLNTGIPIQLNSMLLPHMIDRGWGRIVHLSTVSTTNQTYTGNAAYASAKSALNAYVKSIGRAVAQKNVVVSAVAPGAIHTEGRHFAMMLEENPALMESYFAEHLAIGRLGSSDEIASTVTFLCSKQASFAVGSIFAVDGGAM